MKSKTDSKKLKNRLKLSFAIVFFSLLIFWGCSPSEEGSRKAINQFMIDSGKLKILSTTGIISDLVSAIGGDKVDHIALIAGELDPHSYELVKGDDEKLSRADVIFYNGLGLEHGASLSFALHHHPHVIGLADEIIKGHPESVILVDGVNDPHLWMDISLWGEAIDPVVEALSQQDPENALFFKERGEQLRLRMQASDLKLFEKLQQIPAEKRYLVTSHDAFNYFTRRYLGEEGEDWRPRFAAPEGLSPEGQLSTVHIAEIIAHLAHYHIHVVFPESNVSRDSLKKIIFSGQEKGMKIKIAKEVLYGDALGGASSHATTYLTMMEHNGEVLAKEWMDE